MIRRVIVTTAWLGLLLSLLVSVYVGIACAAAWCLGVLFGLTDLVLLQGLIRALIRSSRKWRFVVYFFAKFVVLYGIGAFILLVLKLDPAWLVAGFSLFLGVATLKILGRLVLASRWMTQERHGAGGRFLRESPEVRSRR